MKVGVPLGNWICCVLNEYIFWSNANSKRLALHKSKTAAWNSYISTPKVGLACVPLGTAPGYASDARCFLYSGIANHKGIVDIGIASFAKSDLVSFGVPLG